MISTQPGGTSLASFKVVTLDSVDDSLNCEGCDPGPYGDQDGEQIFVQRIVPDTNLVFVRLASNGERLCTIRAVDGSAITAFFIHECEGSNRMGARPRRYLFTEMANGSIQMWDLTTAMDQHHSRCQIMSALGGSLGGSVGAEKSPNSSGSSSGSSSNGPTPEELLQLIDECELCSASLNTTPAITPHSSALNLNESSMPSTSAALSPPFPSSQLQQRNDKPTENTYTRAKKPSALEHCRNCALRYCLLFAQGFFLKRFQNMTSLTSSSSPPTESTPICESPEPVPAISPTSPKSKVMQSTTSTVGNAPIMVSKNWAVNSSDTVRDLMQKLRKILRLQAVQNTPLPVASMLWGGAAANATSSAMDIASSAMPKKLTLHYSTTQAWG
uniref:Uncharacterized protein n=1 Tax=Ditylenchus dipsaci TaxID=166011 RepID=A0A915ECJ2_9BILA